MEMELSLVWRSSYMQFSVDMRAVPAAAMYATLPQSENTQKNNIDNTIYTYIDDCKSPFISLIFPPCPIRRSVFFEVLEGLIP